ncbi:hypothetical protein [Pseudomonas sp. LRF_L74]|uniref:hypothetical protein n=1 Tax=Pseudomonas sp. LRF_L74 TaxID=3369422 RepID=UPI003F619D67
MLSIIVGSRWSKARPASARPVDSAWDSSERLDCSMAPGWQQAGAADIDSGSGWDAVPALDSATDGRWGIASPADPAATASPWDEVATKDSGVRAAWDRSIKPRDVALLLIYNPKPAWKDSSISAPVRRVDEFGKRYDAATELQDSLYVPGTGPLVFSFGGKPYFPSTQPSVYFNFIYTAASHRIQPVDSGGAVRWQAARRLQLDARLPWGRARVLDGKITGITYPDYSGPVKPLPDPPPDPETLETYMIANTVNLVVLPDRTPVEAKNIRVSWDADSFSWKWSGDIFTHAALDLVRPDGTGAGELELDINGWTWVLLVERYSRNRRFANEAYTISGGTRQQLLAEPYAPLRTGVNSAPITARQAAEEQLLNTGFTLTWDAENAGPADWTFPAGSFSYQSQTAIQVIAKIAATVGAIVRPARDSDSLEVIPRYPTAPWEWNGVEAPISRIIPPAMMTDLSGEWTPQPDWNACYVSGTSHGVSMLVRRAGTAGDNPTADVFDDWITGEEANRARGVHELSKGGNIEIVGFTIPLFPLTDDHGVGLCLPGNLYRVPEETGSWDGLCLSVEISADGTGAVKVAQVLKLERHY